MERGRLLVTDATKPPLHQATGSLIKTLGRKNMNKNPPAPDLFAKGKFDVEHALNIYAESYSTFPAQYLYEEEFLSKIREASKSFHIYLIGFTPKIHQDTPRFKAGRLIMPISYLDKQLELTFTVPEDFIFIQSSDGFYFKDKDGQSRWIDPEEVAQQLSATVGGCPFIVKYIGQAYGEDGSRDAIDRLLKHETLQKIAIKGTPEGYMLQVVLLSIQTDNRVITVFLPNAENRDDDGTRRKMGLDKLFGTSDAERVSLYEASLIRYFSPEFNKEFKNSFPSTNLKILRDCYRKDFLAVTAEICFDYFPYYLQSETVEKKYYHIITHDLQKDAERQIFFGMKL